MKRTVKAALCTALAASMTLSTACAAQASGAQSKDGSTTLSGKVTAIDADSVTLSLAGPGGPQGLPQPDASGQNTDGQTPPAKPDGSGLTTDGQTPPAKPDGSGLTTDGQTPPAKPDGSDQNADGQTPPAKPEDQQPQSVTLDLTGAEIYTEEKGQQTAASVRDIDVGDLLIVTEAADGTVTSVSILGEPPVGQAPGQPSGIQPSGDGSGSAASQPGGGFGGFGGSGQVAQGTAATDLTSDGTYTGKTYTSTGDDENALRVTGATVTLDGVTVDKKSGSSSNTEDGDFYGMNAALLATDGAKVTIKNAKVTSSAQNGNGVFSYGSGTEVDISDSTITTSADNSGGLQTTGGGTTKAANVTVKTSGDSSAAIRSDRGGGTVDVTGGSYTSTGRNSPAVYSTADITVKDAKLTATGSEALVIEGKNSIALENCAVSGNMSDTEGSSSDENVHNVMIYQSMSGDADVGTSTFTMKGGSLTSNNGDMIYVTNTHSVITLSGVSLTNKDSDGALLRVTGNSAKRGWGTAGANGAQVDFTADAQVLTGDIVVDDISTLDLTLKNGSAFTGTVNIVDNAQNGAAVADNAVVTVEQGCTWTLTGDCTLTSLTNHGTIDFNSHTITLADGTVLQ